jgi:hypothetical protein
MPDGGVTTNIGAIAVTAQPVSAAVLGTLATTTIYFTLFTSPSTGVTLRKYDGTTLGTGTGKPTHVATWASSNRLVQGGYFAAADSPSGRTAPGRRSSSAIPAPQTRTARTTS